MLREIVLIDDEKCDGCGLCVPACHEGAIRIVSGKARLVADNLCDGLGACLGHCPQGAIRVERREAAEFDEEAVKAHLQPVASANKAPPRALEVPPGGPLHVPVANGTPGPGGGCPSQRFIRLGAAGSRPPADRSRSDLPEGPRIPGEPTPVSALGQWPVQLRLLPPRAPVFQDADLLLAADCVPFALPDFHQRLLRGRAVAIACPKLDDTSDYVAKLTEIMAANRLRSITVVHMEVPCCTGILSMALRAREQSGVDLPIEDVVISVRGEVIQRRQIAADAQLGAAAMR